MQQARVSSANRVKDSWPRRLTSASCSYVGCWYAVPRGFTGQAMAQLCVRAGLGWAGLRRWWWPAGNGRRRPAGAHGIPPTASLCPALVWSCLASPAGTDGRHQARHLQCHLERIVPAAAGRKM